METNSTTQPPQPTAVIGGGSGKAPRKTRRLIFVIVGIVVVLIAIGGYFMFRQIQASNADVNKNSDTVVDVSEQITDANQYPKGSYMWANLLLNAAMYASTHEACKQAQDIVDEVKGQKLDEGVDVGAAQSSVSEACHA